jgi:hypothetical protein
VQLPGDTHTHHHGMLAGVGAGTAAVLACTVFVLSVWHRVSGTVAQAVVVLVWALLAAALGAVAFVLGYLFLRLRHHITHPETLTRHTVRAEVIPPSAPAVTGPPPAFPALPPVTHGARWHQPGDHHQEIER